MSGELQSAIAVNELATLLIPVNGKQLVLPNVTVAEIILYVEPQAKDDVPNWYLGSFSWRNTEVPLVSFEAINEEPFVSRSQGCRIAVLNGLVDSQRLPFCGFVIEGVPRLMRIMPDEVATDDEVKAGAAELSRVLVSGEKAAIPDVDFIQQEILKIL
ncbi:MAG: chemotaxis protein CheW [Pseudomonadales bacterium]